MSALGILAIPVLLLVSCNLIDYITGLMASKYRNQKMDSYKGIRGITKKICMWLLVGVGVIVDQLLSYSANVAGITVTWGFRSKEALIKCGATTLADNTIELLQLID